MGYTRLEEWEAIARIRPLTPDELRRVQHCLSRERLKQGNRLTRRWTTADHLELCKMLLRRVEVADIANYFGVSERAIWRRMHVIGVKRGLARANSFRPSLAKGANARDPRER